MQQDLALARRPDSLPWHFHRMKRLTGFGVKDSVTMCVLCRVGDYDAPGHIPQGHGTRHKDATRRCVPATLTAWTARLPRRPSATASAPSATSAPRSMQIPGGPSSSRQRSRRTKSPLRGRRSHAGTGTGVSWSCAAGARTRPRSAKYASTAVVSLVFVPAIDSVLVVLCPVHKRSCRSIVRRAGARPDHACHSLTCRSAAARSRRASASS